MGLYKKGIEKNQEASLVEEKTPLQKKQDLVQKNTGVVKDSVSFRTDIDKFYHILELSGDSVLHTKVLEILDVSSSQVEDWAKLLEKQGLLDIEYTTTGAVLYRLKGALPQQKKENVSPAGIFSTKKRKVVFLVLLLFAILFILLYFFFFDSLLVYFSGGSV